MQISFVNIFFTVLLLVIPLYISLSLGLNLEKDTLISTSRMAIQLFVVGFFLKVIFEANNKLLTIFWIFVMLLFSMMTAIKRSRLKTSVILKPITISFLFSLFFILIYFEKLIVNADLFDSRLSIAISGMLLGNVLSTNIIVLNSFYQELFSKYNLYLYRLSVSVNRYESILPFLKKSFHLAFMPALAKTATMGIVSLPGMMSGQIVAGADVSKAIFYQIAIMVAIFSCGMMSALFTVLLSLKSCFNDFDLLDFNVFKPQKDFFRKKSIKKMMMKKI